MTDTPLPPNHDERRARVQVTLDGLSVGDAFGERLCGFRDRAAAVRREQREVPPPPWPTTDDSEMALGIRDVLVTYGRVDPTALAARFALRYRRKPWRGYGGRAQAILSNIGAGVPWAEAAARPFNGAGSMGNGAAMRVGPIGAYGAGDHLTVVAREARLSAGVTHAHPEGMAGAIAVAVAVAMAWRVRGMPVGEARQSIFDAVRSLTPDGETAAGIARASELPTDTPLHEAVTQLGNGSKIIAPDTVPLCLWNATRYLLDYSRALWTTADAGGDMDTNCAIVGAIVVSATGPESLPAPWLAAREPLELDVVDDGPHARA